MKDAPRLAAAYIRVSTDDQTEYSPDAQRRALQHWVEEHGMVLLPEHIYVDEGISGRKASKRPGFQAMITAARSKPRPFDVILVHKFDRFARSREDSIVYKSLLQRDCGISVISITESIDDGGSGMGMLIEAISEAYAEFYSVNLGREVKKGMTEKARRGGLQSNPSFGYTVEEHKLVPMPEEAEIVREIFSRFLAGEGFYPIARELNRRGIRTHRGNPWENRTVEYLLRNPVYIGKLRWNTSGRSRRNFDHPDIILANAEHEPLIDMETWEAAQRRVAEVKAAWGYKARPTSELKDWMGGVVRCAECGATLIFTKPHYFKCNNYVRGRCAKSQHVSVEALHEALLDRLQQDMESAASLAVEITYSSRRGGGELALLERQLAEAERRLERLRDAYLDGVEDLDAYRRGKEKLEAHMSELRAGIEAIRSAVSPETVMQQLRQNIANAYATLTAPDATLEAKNTALRAIIAECSWNKEDKTLSIVYRYIF